MTGAEITAAGLSVPQLLIRFLSDDDNKGVEGTGANNVPVLSGKKKAGAMESVLILIISAQWVAVLLEVAFFGSGSPRNFKFKAHVSVIQ